MVLSQHWTGCTFIANQNCICCVEMIVRKRQGGVCGRKCVGIVCVCVCARVCACVCVRIFIYLHYAGEIYQGVSCGSASNIAKKLARFEQFFFTGVNGSQ